MRHASELVPCSVFLFLLSPFRSEQPPFASPSQVHGPMDFDAG